MNYFVFCLVIGGIHLSKADYYWRDYNGTIPSDAIEGGVDENGEITYIGQTFFPAQNVLFVTTIKQGSRLAYSDWDGPIKSDTFTKILCSANPKTLKWVPTSMQKLRYLIKCRQIIGGVNEQAVITIGRALYNGQIYLGKIYDYPKYDWVGMWFLDRKKKEVLLKSFEVLTDDCSDQVIRKHIAFGLD